MKKTFYRNNEETTVDEITDVVAIKVAESTDELIEEADAFGEPIRSEEEAEFDISGEQYEAFAQAGWIFIHPSDETARASDAEEVPEGAEALGRVFRTEDGQTLISTGVMNVKLQSSLSQEEAEELLEERGLEPLQKLNFSSNLYQVRTSSDPLETSVRLHDDEAFEFAEPDFIEHIPPRFSPTDPDYNRQWHWNNNGTNGITTGADVDAEAAWDESRGSETRVAVIDNGINVNHPDLADAVVDGGSFRSDPSGGATFTQGTTEFPPGNHGTFCAGMAVARANNGRGGCGIANLAGLIPIATLNDTIGSQVTLARAVAYAADPRQEVPGADPTDGADVISCSLGPNDTPWQMSGALRLAIDFAVTNGREGQGTPVFWAVDNESNPVSQDQVCAYENTIAVGRSDSDDTEDGSAFGPELDFLAPGVDVYSTTSNGYGTSTGTSYATPCAAGIGALVIDTDTDLSWEEIRGLLRDTCEEVGGVTYDANGHHDNYGFGRLNARQAVREVAGPTRVVDNFGYDAGGWRVEKHPRFLADLTGDGTDDIVGFGDAGVWTALNNGDGTFQPLSQVVDDFAHDAGGWRVEKHPRYLADLTGDGTDDIVGFGDAGVWVALNNGDGTFQPLSRVVDDFAYDAGGWRVEKHPRYLADLTGDGTDDIVGFGDAGVWVALNNGDGTFQPLSQVVDNFGYQVPGGWRIEKHPRFLADLTGDGTDDIVGFGDAGVWVAFNNGNGTFQPLTRVVDDFGYDAGGWRVEKHPRFLADLTGDGTDDIVGFGDAGVWVAFNNGGGTFQPLTRVVDNFAYDAGGWRVDKHPRYLADLTGDGTDDIVGFGDAGVWVALNNGDGTFQPLSRVVNDFAHDAGGWRVEKHPRFLADLTGDGADDIVGFGDAGVWVALNNGDGTF